MRVAIEIECDNAGFEDDAEVEVARILRDLADRIVNRGLRIGDSDNLMDHNGNVVGSWVVGEGAGEPPPMDLDADDGEPLGMDEWRDRWDRQVEEHAFVALATNWHAGQWTAFYKLQCAGRILDGEHARDVASEARDNLRLIGREHGDYDAMEALERIADEYPQPEEEE